MVGTQLNIPVCEHSGDGEGGDDDRRYVGPFLEGLRKGAKDTENEPWI